MSTSLDFPIVSDWNERNNDQSNNNQLHELCHNANIDPRILQDVINNNPEFSHQVNCLGQTPLHVACSLGGPKCNILEVLLVGASSSTKHRDNNVANMMDTAFKRPIDYVCQKIVMKEERARYAGRRQQRHSEQQEQERVSDLWICAHILVKAMGLSPPLFYSTFSSICQNDATSPLQSQQQPMVHSCLRIGSACPFALWDRVLQKFPNDLQETDYQGNLPLHIAAAIRPSQLATRTTGDGDGDEEDRLNEILSSYRDAARIRNNDGKLPLNLAIEAGRMWDTGCRDLLMTYPAALANMDCRYFPFLISHFGKNTENINIIYGVLLAMPDIIPSPSKV